MKLLITGMTSRQVNERSRDGYITLSGVMASALRELGHEVDVKPYAIKEALEQKPDYDRIFVGLGPLKGIGTAYMYGAIHALSDFYDDAYVFVDDTDTRKMGREFKAVLKRPFDYTKPFFMYKREWMLVESNASIKNRHLSVIEKLAGNESSHWPTLVPSWTSDLAYAAAAKLSSRAADESISFDPSNYFAVDLEVSTKSRENVWGTQWNVPSPAINKMGVHSWDVEKIETYSLHRMSEVAGILVPSSTWAPEITIAASVGTPVAADWRTLGPYLGPSFEALPANIELLSEKDRQNLAKEQQYALISLSTGLTTKVLQDLLGDSEISEC